MVLLKKYFWFLIAVIVFAIDYFSKSLALKYLPLETPVEVFPMFNLYFTYNTGAAFSFLHQAGGWQEWLFIIIAILVSVSLIVWQIKIDIKDVWLKTSLALVLGGTLGNFYDRVVYHKVIDFLDFYYQKWHYPIFNIADVAICIGAAMLVLDILRKEKK